MRQENEKRPRRVVLPMSDFGNDWIDVDVDEQWSWLESLTEIERICTFCERLTWDVILDDLENPPEVRKKFRKDFFSAGSANSRHKAIYGKAVSSNKLSTLVMAARAYDRHELSWMPEMDGKPNPTPLYVDATSDGGREWDAALIGSVFARWVCGSGLESVAKELKNLADAEKTQARRILEGHELYAEGLVWRAFCDQILNSKRLPSENDLNTTIHQRWKRTVDTSQMGRRCKSLGISWKNSVEKSK